jgi:adenylate cyclase
MKRRDQLRTGLFLLVGLAAAVLMVAFYLAPRWKPVREAFSSSTTLENKSIDARFSIRGVKKPPDDVVIVGIDDVTFQDMHERWPFTRDFHAKVINRLHKDGAKVIIMDVQFTEPEGNSPEAVEHDNALLLACQRAKNCVLSSTEVNNKGQTAVFGGPEGQKFAHALVGNGNTIDDSDGVLRHMYFARQKLPALTIVGYERMTGKTVKASDLGADTTYIDYFGPGGTFKRVPFSHVCPGCGKDEQGKPKRIPETAPGFFKDKVVIVGPIAPSLHDIHDTPFDSVMPGAEYHANAFETVREGFPLSDSPTWLDILLIVGLALVAPLASIKLRLWGIGLAVASAALYAVAAQIAFNGGEVLSFTYPLGSLILSAVGSLAVHYVTEAFERARVRDTFSRFVPESVVGEVLDQADGLRLGGVGRTATVMFSDLRGFTSFAERLEPDQVIRILNRYLTAMVDDAIIPNGGTLVDYMGDGIMAVFGAPIEMPDHADRALRASRAKLKELEKFNVWMEAEYGFDKSFRMGIGLNSGRVMSGNVGSENRLAYTAIGDTTNTAARLEGMTKGTDYMLFLANSTKEALVDPPDDMQKVGEYEIRGRRERVEIWSVQESFKEQEPDETFASIASGPTLADK